MSEARQKGMREFWLHFDPLVVRFIPWTCREGEVIHVREVSPDEESEPSQSRKEQIKNAAYDEFPEDGFTVHYTDHDIRDAFRKGAEWDDKNPLHRTESFALMKELVDGITLKYVNAESELTRLRTVVRDAKDILESVAASPGFSVPFKAKKWLSRHGGVE